MGDVLDGVIVSSATGAAGDDPDAAVRSRPDGAGANTAAWIGWLGGTVDLVGRVGVDDVYRHGAALADAGVTPHLRYDPAAATGAVVSVVGPDGLVRLTDPAASGRLTGADVEPALVAAADVVHLTGAGFLGSAGPDGIAELVRRAVAADARVSVDPSSAARITAMGPDAVLAALDGVHLIVPDVDEGRALTGLDDPVAIAKRLSEHVPLVALTLGADGVLIGRPGRTPQRVPVVATPVVDAVGVGDAFAAGFLRSWATDPIRVGAAAREGGRVAARSLGMAGARPPV